MSQSNWLIEYTDLSNHNIIIVFEGSVLRLDELNKVLQKQSLMFFGGKNATVYLGC